MSPVAMTDGPPISHGGWALIVMSRRLLAGPHEPAGSLVTSVSTTDPASISACEGVYFGFSAKRLGSKVPVPPLHEALVAAPPIDPASVTSGLLAHTVCA